MRMHRTTTALFLSMPAAAPPVPSRSTSLFQVVQLLHDLTTMSATVTQAMQQLTGARPCSVPHVASSIFNKVCDNAWWITSTASRLSSNSYPLPSTWYRKTYVSHNVLLLDTDMRPFLLRLEPKDLHGHELRGSHGRGHARVADRMVQQL